MARYIFTVLFCFSLSAHAQIITTFAGTGINGFSGDNGQATVAKITNPGANVIDKFGNYYFSDFEGERIRKINTVGIITTVAGTGISGYNGDNILANTAQLRNPSGVTCDTFGNVFISDHQNYRIRKIDITTGIISTIAGTGSLGDSGDGGAAAAAMFFPCDIIFDKKGNLYISDNNYNKIRKINSAGIISTFAGTGTAAFSGDGGPAIDADLWYPTFLAVDDTGNIYVVDADNRRIRKIDTFGIITTVAGTGTEAYNGDEIAATIANIGPVGVKFYNDMLYISDDYNQRIRAVSPDGMIHTIVGTGIGGYNGDNILATTADIYNPAGITFDTCGNMYFTDPSNYRIRKVTFDSTCGKADTTHTDTTNAVQNIKSGGFSVYPNPANLTLTISEGEGINSVALYNMLGQVVYDKAFMQQQKITIDISALPNGVYFVKVNGVHVEKVLKE